MSQYPDARFLTSANAPEQFVTDGGVEVAVAGRSNAGKSSAINAIVNRRGFARVSKTPGRTRLVNFFALAAGRRLVDLPGYGYARVDAGTQAHWGALIQAYFESRRSLAGLLLVVDARRGLGEFDERMLALAASVTLPVHVLLTKADKLKRGRAASALQTARKRLADTASVQLFSALRATGVDQARERLEALLADTRGERAGRKNPGMFLRNIRGK